ncbi:MAG: TRAP transporter large permease subunit, partial [Acidimicrobiia bacterium]
MLDALGLDLGEFFAMVMFLVFMGMILTGYNVAFSFAATGVMFTFLGHVFDVFDPRTLNALPLKWAENLGRSGNNVLLAVPLFVLMGAILERSGLAERLLRAIGMLMGPLRGGVAAAVIVVGTLLAAATGVVAATVIVMGLLSLPAMVSLGYDHKLATGAITASGTLAQLLPPSLVLILLAQQIGVGIIGLFAGALIPGLLLAGLYVVYALGISAIRPEVGPAMPKDQRTLNGTVTTPHVLIISVILSSLLFVVVLSLSSAGTALLVAAISFVVIVGLLLMGSMLVAEVVVSIVPTVLLIMGVLAAIFNGIATPSEAGSIGVLGALLLGVLNDYFDRVLHQ